MNVKELFVINCKNYDETSGTKIIKLVNTAKQISKKFGVKIAISPPSHLLSQVAGQSLAIFAQHLDNSKIGSTTGFMVPELVKKSKVNGSLINHSEHRISSKDISQLVLKLRKLKMI